MRNSNCQLCSLCHSSEVVCLIDEPVDSPVMVIGDAPTGTDLRSGSYLSGRLGQTLIDDLASIGVTDFYYTGIVKCQPPDGRKPEPSEIRACAGYLQAEIERQKPKFVLVVGATAVKAVCKEATLSAAVGKVIERDGITYVPCFSPAYVIRDPGKMPEYKRTLRRFKDVMNGNLSKGEANIRIRIVDRSNLDEFQQQFSQEKEFTCDLETSGLDHYHPDSYINCVGVYLPKSATSWVIPIRKAPTLPAEAQKKLLQWMADQRIPVVNQNWKFDSLWLWQKMRVQFYNKFDTMLAHYNLDENSPHGLKENARLYLNAPDYDLTASEKKGNVEASKLFTYCARDTYYTHELKKIYSRELMQDSDSRRIFKYLTMPASRMYEVIEREGHYVNMERFQRTERELSERLKLAEAQLNRTLGKVINWNSSKQVGEALYGTLGLTPSVFTEKGAPSSGEAALADLDHPVVAMLVEYRSLQKMLSTYIEGWKEFMVGPNLFLGTKLHGTVTGRYSSRLHQVPRDGTIRNLIEAPEGWTFIQGDLSQAELRVAAIASGDPELIRCYNEGIDVHWRTTISVLQMGGSSEYIQMARDTVAIDYPEDAQAPLEVICRRLEEMGHDRAIEIDKRWKEKRKQSKGINFGYIYGMGARKFAEYAKLKYDWEVDLYEAEEIRNAFFSMYSSLPAWHERQRQLVRIDGFVRSLIGRKRRLPGIWSPDKGVRAECERQAINSPIQGFIGDLKVMGMLDIYERIQVPSEGRVLRIKGEVHDSILMWVKTEHLDQILPQIKECMERPSTLEHFGVTLPVPIVADLEIGTWGAGKIWKP